MLTSARRLGTAFLIAAPLALLPTPNARGDISGFSGFSPINTVGPSVGDPAIGYSLDGSTFELTDSQNGEGTSGFFPTPQDITAFNASFSFTSVPVFDGHGQVAADGVALVLQSSITGSTAALGNGGGDRGYGGIPGPSAALLFDSFGYLYYFAGSTTFQTNSGTAVVNAPTHGLTAVNLSNGTPITVSLAYSGTTLTETVTNPQTLAFDTFTYTGIDLPTLFASTTGYVGFSGSTGGYSATATVSNFTYTATAVPEPSSWVALLGGVGCLGSVLRRRRLS